MQMNRIYKFLSIVFIAICLSNMATITNSKAETLSQKSAEIEKKKQLTLNDILFYTYENNDEIKAHRERLKIVETAKFKTFGANTLPEIYLNSTRGRKNTDRDVSNQNYKTTHNTESDKIVLTQPIFKSGRTVTSLKVADSDIQIQKNKLVSIEQTVLFEAVIAGLNILKTKNIYEITKQNEESLKQGYEYSKARKRVGKATVTEVYTSESRYKDALSKTAIARSHMLIAKANFERIVGLNPDYLNIKQIEVLFNYINKDNITRELVVEKSMKNNPDYLVTKENYKLNQNALNFSKTDFLPSMTLDAGVSRTKSYGATTGAAMTRTSEGFVDLNLRVPLVQSGVKYADYKSSQYSVNQTKFELQREKRILRERSIQTHEEFLLSRELIKSVESARDAAKIALNSSMEESRVGKITMLDVLDRRKEYFESQINVIEAKADNILKFYSLKVLMGEMILTNLEISKQL
jgi:outer membrane protein